MKNDEKSQYFKSALHVHHSFVLGVVARMQTGHDSTAYHSRANQSRYGAKQTRDSDSESDGKTKTTPNMKLSDSKHEAKRKQTLSKAKDKAYRQQAHGKKTHCDVNGKQPIPPQTVSRWELPWELQTDRPSGRLWAR